MRFTSGLRKWAQDGKRRGYTIRSLIAHPLLHSPSQAGALSGLTVDLLFYPIDTIKTRLQSSQGFVKSGGFNGVYRGLGSVAVGSAPGGELCW